MHRSPAIASACLLLAGCAAHPRAPAVTSPAPSVGWAVDDAAGGFETSGLPAVAADGSAVLVAVTAAEVDEGTPSLELQVRDRRGAVQARHEVPGPPLDGAGEPSPPTPEQLAEANTFLAAQHRQLRWTPMATAAVEGSDPEAGPA